MAVGWSDTFSTLTPRVLLDLLLISLILQRLLTLFRGAVSIALAVASAILWLLHAAASDLDLVLTSRFLEAAQPLVAIVIIVAFRNEIRDVLVHTDPSRILFGHTETKLPGHRLDEACDALFQMAADRVGALVVFQIRDRLFDSVQGGVTLGGQISEPILIAIFSKESPVHDGAAVVRGHRIERVGTILPLSTRVDLPGQYGTRHRAAIGLSEQSDAVVVVVSEERGEVSIAHRGVVSESASAPELGQSLRLLLGSDQDGRRLKVIRRELMRQFGVFLLTFAAVLGYWVIYFGRHISVTTLTVPIDYRNLPNGFELGSRSEESVEIQLRGQGPVIEDLKRHPEEVNLSVDLAKLGLGDNQTVHLSEADLDLPTGVSVDRVIPSSLTIDLAQRISRSVKVRPVLTVPIPEGYDLIVEPETVMLVGPASTIARVDTLDTSPTALAEPPEGRDEASFTVPLASPWSDTIRLGADQPRQVRLILRKQVEPTPEPSTNQDQPKEEPHPEDR